LSNPPPLLEIRHLVKRFGDKTVLDGIDLVIERGETVAVIGGSGCGKSTLARLVVGLDRATEGQILVDGLDLTAAHDDELRLLRRRFAMVFQRGALLDSLSVYDNVAFPLREETNLDARTIRERVTRTLGELGVAGTEALLPSQLSGGMAKRVSIARAMVMEPEILVYDEPTSGLDPVSSRVVDGLIEQMREKFLVTSIVITHDMVSAYEISDRVVLLAGGKVVANGAPDAIFRSHSGMIAPFALSSGIDLDKLAPRAARKPPAQIQALWAESHARGAIARRPWYDRWAEALRHLGRR
jgi:phospholipid/cholesterol/gamma-HCH transport system ATP-binding protein